MNPLSSPAPRIFLALLLMGTPLLAIMPAAVQGTELTTGWATEIVGVSDAVAGVQLAGSGSTVGLAFQTSAGNHVGFATRGTSGTWTVQASDITAGVAQLSDPDLCQIDASTWLIAAKLALGTSVRVYRTTDGGATWAITKTLVNSLWEGGMDCLGTQVALLHVATGNPVRVNLEKSSDGGATWASTVVVDDNKANPADTGTAFMSNVGPVDVAIQDATHMVLAITGLDNGGSQSVFVMRSNDGGLFWNIPFLAEGGSAIGIGQDYGGTCSPQPGLAARGATGVLADSNFCDAAHQPVTNTWSVALGGNQAVSNMRQEDSNGANAGGAVNYVAGKAAQRTQPSVNLAGRAVLPIAGIGADGIGLSVWTRTDQTGAWTQIYHHDGVDTGNGVISSYVTADQAFAAYRNGANGGRLEVISANLATVIAPPPPPPPPPSTDPNTASATPYDSGTPIANSATYTETFEAAAAGSIPKNTWYDESESGSSSSVAVAATTLTGSTKAAAWSCVNCGGGAIWALGTNVDGINACETGQSVSFDVYVPALNAGNSAYVFMGSPQASPGIAAPNLPPNTYGLLIVYASATTVTVSTVMQRSSTVSATDIGASLGTFTVPALYSASMAGAGCGTGMRVGYTFGTGVGTQSMASQIQPFAKVLNVANKAGNGPNNPYYFDNIAFHGVAAPPRTANYETFESFSPAAPPTETYYTFTQTQDTANDAAPNVRYCERFQTLYNGGSTTYVADLASNCLTTAGGRMVFDLGAGITLCNAIETSFAMNLAPSVAGKLTYLRLQDDTSSTPTNKIELSQADPAGVQALQATYTIKQGATSLTGALAMNPLWDRYGFSCGLNSDPKGVTIKTASGTNQVFTTSTWAAWSTINLRYLVIDSTGAGTGTGTGSALTSIDNINFPKITAAIVGPAIDRVLTRHLLGFDVDYTGDVVATRQKGSDTPQSGIIAYSGLTLSDSGAVAQTYCNLQDGVAAIPGYITYTDCSSSDNAYTNNLEIRSKTLGDPRPPAGTNCNQEPTSGSFTNAFLSKFELPGNLHQLGRIQGAEWDFKNHLVGVDNAVFGTVGECIISWTFSTSDGYVGVYSVIRNTQLSEANDDSAVFAQPQYESSGPVRQMCSWRDSQRNDLQPRTYGSDLILAASLNVPTKEWVVDSGQNDATDLGNDGSGGIHPTIDYLATLALPPMMGIACAGNVIVGMTTTGQLVGVKAIGPDATPSTPFICLHPACTLDVQWTVNLPGGATGLEPRDIAISGDSKWGAYKVGQTVTIFNTTNGNTKVTLPIVSTNALVGMNIDFAGNTLFMGLNDPASNAGHIYRWDIHTVTTARYTPNGGGPTACEFGCGTCNADSGAQVGSTCDPTTGNCLTNCAGKTASTGGIIDVSNGCGISTDAGGCGWYIAIIMIVAMAIGIPVSMKQQDILPKGWGGAAAAGGAALGLILTWVLKLIPTEGIFIVAILVLGPSVGFVMYQKRAA